MGSESDLLSWQIYCELLVWILLIFESFRSYLSHRLTIKDEILFSFSIRWKVSIKYLHSIVLELLPEGVFILLICLDSINLFLESLECLLSPLPLSHLSKCLLSL